jgi:hypothetical protein
MTSPELDRLVTTGSLHREAASASEIDGLMRSADARLRDARTAALSLDSRFDLGYNAAHAIASAALRWHGYRAQNRYVVFQVLSHTLGVKASTWRVLDKCHRVRNETESQGVHEIDPKLVEELMTAASAIQDAMRELVGTP